MATPAFLVRLMAYTRLSRSIKVGPEDSEALAFATELRARTLTGELQCVWTHPANELAGIGKMVRGKFRSSPQAALARALGLITGSSDYLFLAADMSLAIEFKSRTGTLTEGQKDFRSWCEALDVPFHVCRTAAEGIAVLSSYGLIERKDAADHA